MKDLVLLTGANGYLGSYVLTELSNRGMRVLTAGRSDCDVIIDLADLDGACQMVEQVRPRFVLNLAALSSIQDCMERPELAAAVNASAPQRMARVAPGRFLQVSTDLVFDGNDAPYAPDAEPQPCSVYGMTKHEGEKLAGHSVVAVRVPLLFGPSPDLMRGATDMVRRAVKTETPLTLFTNEYRTPLHAQDAAAGLVDVLLDESQCGVRHLAGYQRLSRWELARRFAEAVGLDVGCIQPGSNDDPRRPADVSLISDWRPPRSLEEALAES